MTKSDGGTQADVASLGFSTEEHCDNLDTEAARCAYRLRQFEWYKATLLSGQAWRLDMEPEQLAFQALDELQWLLRHGAAHPGTMGAMADLLSEVLDASAESAPQWEHSARVAFRLLGYRKNGRPNRKHAMSRALAEFEIRRGSGESLLDCERHAYDAYYAVLEKRSGAYALDAQRPVTTYRSDGGAIPSNEAERFLENELRPLLRKEGMLVAKARGRKAKLGK